MKLAKLQTVHLDLSDEQHLATEKAGKDELDRVFAEEDAHRVAEEAVGRSSYNNNGIWSVYWQSYHFHYSCCSEWEKTTNGA